MSKGRYYIIRYKDGIVCQDCGIIISNKSAENARDEFHSTGFPVEIVELYEQIQYITPR